MDIIGHAAVTRELERAIAEDRLPNALIIAGPQGVGKTQLAREIARTLNCTADQRPCGHCVHCRQIVAGTHPDVIAIARRDGKSAISIEQVRELREEAALRPFQGRYKVYVIEGAETLTAQAADAMLKTLEEPPSDLIMILTVLDPAALPETVVSRCRIVTLSSLSEKEIVEALRSAGASGGDAADLARLAQGSIGWALRARERPKLREEREALLENLDALPRMGLAERLDLAEKLAGEKKDRVVPRAALEALALLMRDRLLARASDGPPVAELVALRAVRRAMDRLDSNVDPRLTLEALFVALS